MNRTLRHISEDKESSDGEMVCNNTNVIVNCSNTNCSTFDSSHFNDTRKYSVEEECVLDKRRKQHLKELRCILKLNISVEKALRVEYFVKLLQTQEILVKLFEIFDYHQNNKLNQDKWIDFLKSKLNQFDDGTTKSQIESKYVGFIEVLESVAYAVCGDEDINFDIFCKIFKTKNVLNKLFRLIDRDLDGVITVEQVMEFISQFSSARSGSRLTKDNVVYLEKLFRQYVGEENEIKKEDFSKIIQTKNQFFTDRVFDIFDEDASGSISLQEFLEAMHRFTGENPEDKIRFLFKVYDVDGDGLIQEKELEQVMRACMEENGMKFSDEQIHELTTALFEDADVERRGALTYDALKGQLEKHGGLLENLSISIERWLVPVKPIDKPTTEQSLITKLRSLKPHQLSRRYLKNNYVYVLWLIGLIITNCVLFISRVLLFREKNPDATIHLVLARGAGQCLNFNCTFIVVVMLRQSLTFLRSHGASAFMPIDQHIYFHKMTGWFIFIFSSLHTVTHLLNIEYGLVRNSIHNTTYLQYLFDPNTTKPLGLIHGFAFNTGVILMLILIIMVICSLPFVRRGGRFEIFYYIHFLYLAFWTLLIVHAPNFWKWFLVPGIIFTLEQILRFYRWRVGRGQTYISSGILLPSKVTHLIIKRPHTFDFRPGDYVFVRIPRIAKYEWHPFTISSSPEQEDAIWLHIRGVGEWTNRLHEYFQTEQSNLNSGLLEVYTSLNRRSIKSTVEESISNEKRTQEGTNDKDFVTSNQKPRTQFKSITDSHTSLSPESSTHSSNESDYGSDVISSEDKSNDIDEVIRRNKVPILMRNTLDKRNSMPNVNERMTNRERKLILRQVVRSESVGTGSDQTAANSRNSTTQRRPASSPFSSSSRDSAVLSVRYMRNKPRIISLHTPSSDESESRQTLLPGKRKKVNSNCIDDMDRAAEEGKSNNRQQNEIGAGCYELTGTTRVSTEQLPVGRSLEIFIDGPYGAPSSQVLFRAEHAVLIATGIGVTPFASILQSIMRRYWASRNTCPKCSYTWCSDIPQSVLNLQKVDFFWINRDQKSFEWFVHLLSQLEIEQAELGGAMERFLDMHMYITSALQRTDMKAVGLQLALDLLHEKEKRDLITGLKTRTNAGRPNWNKIFQQLQDQKKGKVTVFYCGPPSLARTLKIKCDEFGFSFRKELF